jgi:hypothetical protein
MWNPCKLGGCLILPPPYLKVEPPASCPDREQEYEDVRVGAVEVLDGRLTALKRGGAIDAPVYTKRGKHQQGIGYNRELQKFRGVELLMRLHRGLGAYFRTTR